jgi:hypothetical protein
MFDNLKQLQGKYEKDLADYRGQQDRRTQVVGTLVTASFFGGLGLLLLVTMLGLMKVVSGFRLWMPAIGSIVCCLILGAVLMDPSRLGSGDAAVTGFSPYQAPPADPPPEAKDETEKHDGDRPKIPEKPFVFHEYAHPSMSAATGGGRKATETLYWHPCLSTGPDGRAEVRFVVPPQPGRFRVLVEAHGEGRIGSLALEFTL